VSVGRVARDVREPLDRLKHSVRRLKNVHQASHVIRRVGWFLVARKKLRAALAGKVCALGANHPTISSHSPSAIFPPFALLVYLGRRR